MSDVKSICSPILTHKEKIWKYEQYYIGEKDEEDRKSGEGELHWSGAQSLESYTGHFFRDTMHGMGDYRWRYLGPENSFVTYEGNFYCNRMHGYGTMSYSDGRIFSGLFFNNVRWGPGVQSHTDLHEDVGLWRRHQLVRLAWQPEGPKIVPDFVNSDNGKEIVKSHRIILATEVEIIGQTNKAIELLKQCGADPRVAVEKWNKMYPKHCTDLASPLCNIASFDQDYYKGKIYTLKELSVISQGHENELSDEDAPEDHQIYYAWNNDNMMINMMKHSFKHQKQLNVTRLNLTSILSGPRRLFKPASDYEIDCRTLLMAAYLNRVEDVAYLVNEKNINPCISDVQGNSAIMYAAVGDQPDVIHFLVEAGAYVDSNNDSCCTALGVALMRYVCAKNDLHASTMPQTLLPPPLPQAPPLAEPIVKDWNISREQFSDNRYTLVKSPSKSTRTMSSRKMKSLLSIKDQPGVKRKLDNAQPKTLDPVYESYESIKEDSLYTSISREFSIKITDIFTPINGTKSPVPYVFQVTDMVKEVDVDVPEDDQKKQPDKSLKKLISLKTFKDSRKTSLEAMWQRSSEKAMDSLSSIEKLKEYKLTKIKATILQLLSDGAHPKLVRCPQPALLIAVMCGSPVLLNRLVDCGADINENYHQVFDYSPLDVAISRPLTNDSLEIVKTVLKRGGDAQHRLVHEVDHNDPDADQIPGPTLLHVVLAKKAESEFEEDIRCQMLDLLLEYNCSATILYKGRSALDVAMSKGSGILKVFIKNPKTDLNANINKYNQSIIVKMFSLPYFRSISSTQRLQQFTDVLLFGADPLLTCQNNDDTYQNIFVFAKRTLSEMDSLPVSKTSDTKINKKGEKPKKDDKSSTKQVGRTLEDVEDYKQAVDLVSDCARLIYIRWLQAKLVKELIVTIDKFKHRDWSMILRSCQNKRSTGLWLNPQRCLEVWDILSETKKKTYNDRRILNHLLCIVIFLTWQNSGSCKSNITEDTKLTIQIKDYIEADANKILSQHKADKNYKSEMKLKLSYVKPELVRHATKFNVCFECILPLNEDKILCSWCNQISFCSYDCMKSNVQRSNCHPCGEYSIKKLFSSCDENFDKFL